MAVGLTLPARQQPFKSGARTVAVYATVTDAAGRLVPDLTRDDFEVYDNGKLQPVSVFSNDIQPITSSSCSIAAGACRPTTALVEAGRRGVRAQTAARRQGAHRQLRRRGSRSIHASSRATRRSCCEILRTELQPDGPTPLWNAVNVGMTALLRQEGRRVVLVFTDGVDWPMNFSTHNVSLHDAMKRAQEEDVMVYAIGLAEPRCPTAAGGTAAGMAGTAGAAAWAGMAAWRVRPRSGSGTRQGPRRRLRSETGGGYFELTNRRSCESTFARVADELHHQYALGFVPAKLDNKTHSIEVRLKRPGLTARTRKSYVAAADRAPTE